jgi:integrase/recombinase XerC
MRETEFSPNPSQELDDVEAITCVKAHYRTSDISPFEAFLMGDSSLSQPLKGGYAQGVEPDLIQELLNDKRSPNTKRAYARDLKDFFRVIAVSQPTPELVTQFLQLDRFKAIALVLRYKANLLERQLSEASVNRRLAAVKSLVKFARKIGKCDFTLEDVEGEKIRSYRDTTGISPTAFKKMLFVPNRKTLKGKRDYAILHLLWSNGLEKG